MLLFVWVSIILGFAYMLNSYQRPKTDGGAGIPIPFLILVAVAAMMTAMRQELREHNIRTCTIYPAEVDTPILDNRPLPPDKTARSTMMMPEDIAETILLCMRMPQRTIVQDLIVSPTIQRDTSEDMKIAKSLGKK